MIELLPLRVEGARYAYGARRVLDGVDLAVAEGEVCALIGPNGAGKSTLIRLVCGRLAPDSGLVRVAGRDPARDKAARALIGFVPQEIALYPKLTVRENLAAFAAFAADGRAASAAAIDRAVALAAAGPIAARRVETLSGGEKRRANVAAALLGAPRLLVLDEPTVGVDAESREVIHHAVRAARAEGVAALIATHDLDQAEALADRIALMGASRVLRCGPPEALIAEAFGPGAVEVAALLPRPPAAPERAALLRLGLEPVEGDLRWRAVTPGRAAALRLEEELSRLGGAPELRMRGAGLAALAAAVTGERREAAE
jgi:ABC-2 type transport system ATP-binding protein